MNIEDIMSWKDLKRIQRLQMMVDEQQKLIDKHKKKIHEYLYEIDQIKVKYGAEQEIPYYDVTDNK